MAEKSKFAQLATEKTNMKVENISFSKAENKISSPFKAMIAGFIITIIYILISKGKTQIPPMVVDGKTIYNFDAFITGTFFTFALYAIVRADLELATSNMAYSSFSLYNREIKFSSYIKLILGTLGYNFIGAFIGAVLLSMSGVVSAAMLENLNHVAELKAELSPTQIFASAIFANFFIGLAVVMYLESTNDFGRIFSLFTGVFVFGFMGFEHVVANGCLFIFNMVNQPGAMEHILGYGKNIFFAFFGNLVGGGILIGVIQAAIHKNKKETK
jgi:formate/nitrite transporter FocA (FNT family)